MPARPPEEPASRSFLETMTAIGWSFIGLRRRSDFERDVGALKPLYVIGAAVIGAAVLIGVLLTVVQLVVH